MSEMKLSAAGIEELMRSEGKRTKAYQDQAKVWTIGYGHTGKVNGVNIHSGMTISEDKVKELLALRLPEFEKAVSSSIRVPLKQNEFDALVNLAYNIGPTGFKQSNVAKLINEGDFQAAADKMLELNKHTDKDTGQKVFNKGLFDRRVRERELFLGGKIDAPMPDNQFTPFDNPQLAPQKPAGINMQDWQMPFQNAGARATDSTAFTNNFNQLNDTLNAFTEPEPEPIDYQTKYQKELASAFGIEPSTKEMIPDYIGNLVRSVYDQTA